MKKIITEKEIEEIVKTSLELALMENQVISEGYFYEESLRYIVANQINAILSDRNNLVSFPNKKENNYKLVFQCSYTDNKKTVKSNLRTDLAVIRTSAEKFNDAKNAHFYKRIYHQTINNNKGFDLGNEVLSFDTEENSFVIYTDLDPSGNYINSNYISDIEAFQKYQNYKEKKGQEPEDIDLEEQKGYDGNLMVIELKQFSNMPEIKADISRLKGMLDKNEGFECFNFGVFINFGFENNETRKKLVDYLKSETLEKKNLLVAHMDANDENSVQLKWIN